jgi:uncharacterized protein YbjT (DUF2867 family)
MRILITGVTGYIGSRLAPRLLRDGHELRGFTRHPERGAAPAGVELVGGDAITGRGLQEALDGVQTAYFLIHSMEPSPDGAFNVRERKGAENFARAAQAVGLERVIYLGGPAPSHGVASPHLASRLAVEQILASATPCSIAFRASIVIGAASRSFRFLVHLIERLPVMAVPAWGVRRSAPIDERDAIELLARAATSDQVCGCSLDARGRDVVTYGELIDRIRYHMYVERPTIGFRRLSVTPIASRIAALIASEDHELIGTLMQSLEEDLLPRDDRAAELLDVRLHSLDAAIEHSLREWEASEPLAAR